MKKRALTLHRETIRVLRSSELDLVQGGITNRPAPTEDSCMSNCTACCTGSCPDTLLSHCR